MTTDQGRELHALGDQVDQAVSELLTLWPQLASALERDQGGPANERVTTTANVHTIPVNGDVLAAVQELDRDAWPAVWKARDVLGEPGGRISIEETIRSTGVLFRRLVGREKPQDAKRLAHEVFRWHRLVRTAIGLSRRAQPLRGDRGEIRCPLHDDPVTTLRQRGDEGTLHDRRASERITWRSGEGVYCPDRECRARWTPAEYGLLGRLVEAAEERRKAERARMSA
ncbi:hypothetical protein [Actinomadura sp. HBU206391]|uniref:hypothetical protein n=1 Tax=Actinomadura sp. HBU206391 TaxID=2731692 RepID=UPI00164EECE2|nr:hypothetical protein [Actinomadura sp. HBU206391]MBC6458404.1 hypothetical protein [Actinomadura sp. HBU206391]